MFKLRTPCANCPFRTDVAPYLTRERVSGIENATSFICHKTLDYDNNDDSDDSDDGAGKVTRNSQMCAGYMILQEKEQRPTQMLQVMQRLGYYKPETLNMKAPVYGSFDAMRNAMEK